MLGCSKSTLTNRERAGKLRTYYVDSGRRYYKREDVILALKEKDLLIEDDVRSDILYARVSTQNQRIVAIWTDKSHTLSAKSPL